MNTEKHMKIENERFNLLRDKLMDKVLQPGVHNIRDGFQEFLEENLERTPQGYVGDEVYNQFTKLEYVLPEVITSLLMSGLVTIQEPMLKPEMLERYREGTLEGTPFYEDTKKIVTSILTKAIQLMGALNTPNVSTSVRHAPCDDEEKEKPTVV